MNQKQLTFVFLLAQIVLSSGSFLQSGPSIMTELKKLESIDFGRKILDTIALQLNSKAPLKDVAKLLADLKGNLYTQQSESDNLHDSQTNECENDEAAYDDRVSFAVNEIQEATVNLGTLSTEIKRLQASINNANLQLSILAKREANLEVNHEQDADDYQQRLLDHTQVIEALNLIIPKLESITSQESSPQAVFAELAKIGKSNPIAAMVEVAASLDPEALASVISKLSEIRKSVQNSLGADKQHQEESESNYLSLLSEISSVRESQNRRIDEDSEGLYEAQSKYDQELKRKNDNENEIEAAKEGKKQKQVTCAEWNDQYSYDKNQRSEEIGVISKVQEILATRIEGMTDYLKERVNNF